MKKQHLHLVFLVLLAVLLLAACNEKEATSTPIDVPQTVLVVSGSGTTTAILENIKLAFEADTPDYNLGVLPGTGTGGGVEGVLQDTLDVAAMARPLKAEESSQGLEFVEFGRSGVCLYANLGVDVDNLTTAQVMAILAGEITNWSEIGGTSREIVLYVRDEGDSSTQALRDVLVGEIEFSKNAQLITSQADMQTAVASTPGGVGFGSWPSAVAARSEVKALALDGVGPADSDYPIYAPVGLGYRSERQADVQPLIDWLLSERGQALLSELGVITVR